MTLFVDCSNSGFTLTSTKKQTNEIDEKNLIQQDINLFTAEFEEQKNLSGIVFRNLSELGDGFMVSYPTANKQQLIVHIRCTAQDSNCKDYLFVKIENPLAASHFFSSKQKARAILEALKIKLDSESSAFKQVSMRKLKKQVKKMDSELNLNRFKFGVAYLDRFDTSEQQMLANTVEDTENSEEFNNFLSMIGNTIELEGWKGFAGGLDVSEDRLTGNTAVYNKSNTPKESEIIYHITPWLPQSPHDDGNNLERKRHFGNDTVVIIFSESLYAFEMQSLLSRQIQIVLFVRFINRTRNFQVHIYSKKPGIVVEANPCYFNSEKDGEAFTDLVSDLERQCYNNPPLLEKLFCMRNFHLKQLVNKLI
jgi:hypothetical protein